MTLLDVTFNYDERISKWKDQDLVLREFQKSRRADKTTNCVVLCYHNEGYESTEDKVVFRANPTRGTSKFVKEYGYDNVKVIAFEKYKDLYNAIKEALDDEGSLPDIDTCKDIAHYVGCGGIPKYQAYKGSKYILKEMINLRESIGINLRRSYHNTSLFGHGLIRSILDEVYIRGFNMIRGNEMKKNEIVDSNRYTLYSKLDVRITKYMVELAGNNMLDSKCTYFPMHDDAEYVEERAEGLKVRLDRKEELKDMRIRRRKLYEEDV